MEFDPTTPKIVYVWSNTSPCTILNTTKLRNEKTESDRGENAAITSVRHFTAIRASGRRRILKRRNSHPWALNCLASIHGRNRECRASSYARTHKRDTPHSF